MLGSKEAAAYFVVRRSEGLTTSEQGALKEWLAADASHRGTLANAEYVWQVFDEFVDDEILKAMCAHAVVQRPRIESGRRLTVVAAALLVVGVMLVGVASVSRLSARVRQATDRLHRSS